MSRFPRESPYSFLMVRLALQQEARASASTVRQCQTEGLTKQPGQRHVTMSELQECWSQGEDARLSGHPGCPRPSSSRYLLEPGTGQLERPFDHVKPILEI